MSVFIIYIIFESRLSVCHLSPVKRRDVRRRNFACGRVPCVCRTWAGSYVDGGHYWQENDNFKTLHSVRVHFAAASSKAATPNACDPDTL